MQRIRFAEEQIIAVLREHEAGAKTADLARTHGVSEATLYNWNAKYGGVDVSEARRLRALGEENRKLKRLLAESMLDVAALEELLTRQMYGRASKIPVSRSVAAYAKFEDVRGWRNDRAHPTRPIILDEWASKIAGFPGRQTYGLLSAASRFFCSTAKTSLPGTA